MTLDQSFSNLPVTVTWNFCGEICPPLIQSAHSRRSPLPTVFAAAPVCRPLTKNRMDQLTDTTSGEMGASSLLMAL